LTGLTSGQRTIYIASRDPVGNVSNMLTITIPAYIPPPPTYLVTVNNGTGGGSFAEGATVHINANAPPSGEQFKEWVITPTVTFVQGTSTTTPDAEFTMPASNVIATAVFEPIPIGNHLITVTHTGNGVANANVQSAPSGDTITLTSMPDPGSRFVHWEIIGGGITLSDTATMIATFTMPDNAVTVNAVFEEIPDNIVDSSPESFGTWTDSGTRTARVDADREGFIQLSLGGNAVGSSNYTVTEGSTIITLHESYIRTLANGTYTFRAEFTDGFTYLNLTVDVPDEGQTRPPHGVPQTGVDRNLIIPIIALTLGVLFITGAEIYRRRLRKSGKR